MSENGWWEIGGRNPIVIEVTNEHNVVREVKYKKFIFPDDQPHITLDEELQGEQVKITVSICNVVTLFELLLIGDVLKNGNNETHVLIRYLLGGRMDRRIDSRQPDTLQVIANILNTADFDKVEILDPHSPVSLQLIDNSVPVYPHKESDRWFKRFDAERYDTVTIIPDKGARSRVLQVAPDPHRNFVQCLKDRDPLTGRLSGFTVLEPDAVRDKDCLIVDDICDGGGTFTGLSELLRKHGARSVHLWVTHGIFSKGLVSGLDSMASTNSFALRAYSWDREKVKR